MGEKEDIQLATEGGAESVEPIVVARESLYKKERKKEQKKSVNKQVFVKNNNVDFLLLALIYITLGCYI